MMVRIAIPENADIAVQVLRELTENKLHFVFMLHTVDTHCVDLYGLNGLLQVGGRPSYQVVFKPDGHDRKGVLLANHMKKFEAVRYFDEFKKVLLKLMAQNLNQN